MFWAKCTHTREDGLPYLRGEGTCEECGSKIRPQQVERLNRAYAEKRRRALAGPRPTDACACPIQVRIDGKSFSIPAPKRSPLHQIGCPEWYDARANAHEIDAPGHGAAMEA